MPKTTSERRDVSYKLHETIYGVITVNIKWLLIFFLIGLFPAAIDPIIYIEPNLQIFQDVHIYDNMQFFHRYLNKYAFSDSISYM